MMHGVDDRVHTQCVTERVDVLERDQAGDLVARPRARVAGDCVHARLRERTTMHRLGECAGWPPQQGDAKRYRGQQDCRGGSPPSFLLHRPAFAYVYTVSGAPPRRRSYNMNPWVRVC